MKNKSIQLFVLASIILLASCTKENLAIVESEVIKEWSIGISTKNMLPAIGGRSDTGSVNFQLFSDNSIRYELTVKTLSNNDVLSGAALRAGDPVTPGPVVLDLTPTSKFPAANALGGAAYGVVTGVRQSLVDSLLNNSTNLYFQLNSVQYPFGLARGQLNMRVYFSADVILTGSQEVPSVNTNTEGTAWLRLTTDRKLFSRISISNPDPNDPFTMAHIHRAAIGFNGPIVLALASSQADFNTSKQISVDAAMANIIVNDSRLYINAHTVMYPAGKIRGQIRN